MGNLPRSSEASCDARRNGTASPSTCRSLGAGVESRTDHIKSQERKIEQAGFLILVVADVKAARGEALKKAARRFEEVQNWAGDAKAQNNLGSTYQALAQRGVEPQKNLRLATQAFKEANAH